MKLRNVTRKFKIREKEKKFFFFFFLMVAIFTLLSFPLLNANYPARKTNRQLKIPFNKAIISFFFFFLSFFLSLSPSFFLSLSLSFFLSFSLSFFLAKKQQQLLRWYVSFLPARERERQAGLK